MSDEGFLLSVAGLSVSLAGFSGLVAAFRRGGQWKPLDSYRLRQIPEMGLATAFLALATIPIADITGSAPAAIRSVTALALAFTVFHIVVLVLRARAMAIKLPTENFWAAGVIDVAAIGASVVAIVLGSAATYELLLVFLVARPMLAFVLVLADAPGSSA